MSVSIMKLQKEYKLNIETEQISEQQVFLKVEKEYSYDDVWAARNAYEDFFSKPYHYEMADIEDKELHYDKWINMIGDEKCMLVKKVYVYEFDSLKEAHKKERILRKELEEIIESNYWMRERRGDIEKIQLPFGDNQEDKDMLMNATFQEMGMSESSRRVFSRMGVNSLKTLKELKEKNEHRSFSNVGNKQLERCLNELEQLANEHGAEEMLEEIKNSHPVKVCVNEIIKLTMNNFNRVNSKKIFAFTYALPGAMGKANSATIFTLTDGNINRYELNCDYMLASEIYELFPALGEYIENKKTSSDWTKMEMGYGNYLWIKPNIARTMSRLTQIQGPHLYKNHVNFLKKLCEELNFRDADDVFAYREKNEDLSSAYLTVKG